MPSADLAARFDPVHVPHHNIDESDLKRIIDLLKRIAPGGDGDDLMAVRLKRRTEKIAGFDVVFDYEYLHAVNYEKKHAGQTIHSE